MFDRIFLFFYRRLAKPAPTDCRYCAISEGLGYIRLRSTRL
jgi:hypothetical protein